MIVRTAKSKSDYEAVATLMRAFVEWHGERHAADRHIVESYFDPVTFSEELDNLSTRQPRPTIQPEIQFPWSKNAIVSFVVQ
jgi:hypothetical protein